MFFLTQDKSKLTLNTIESKADPESEIILIQGLQKVVRVGKNSLFDTYLEHFNDIQTLTFFGKAFVPLKEDLGLAIYRIQNNSGFLVHNQKTNTVHVSTSLSSIIDHNIIDQNLSILGILHHELGADFTTIPIIINNDLTGKKILQNDLNHETQMYFNLGWDSGQDYYPFGAIIDIANYKVDKNHLLYTKYTGTLTNVGEFMSVSQNSVKGEIPADATDILAYSDCLLITNLFDDNALTTLVPTILKHSEYSAMIKEMRSMGRKQLTLSAASNNGYGVQAKIELLDDSESTSTYKAKITKLVITPNDIILENFPDL